MFYLEGTILESLGEVLRMYRQDRFVGFKLVWSADDGTIRKLFRLVEPKSQQSVSFTAEIIWNGIRMPNLAKPSFSALN